jgi:hypothetical protein
VAGNLASLVAAVNISGGTLTVNGPIGPGAVTNLVTSNLTLSGGTLNMQGNNIGSLTNLTFSGGTLQNLGTLNRALTQTGGTLLRDTAGATSITGAYTLSGGTARVLAGSLTATGGITVSGTGVLAGNGTVNGAVNINSGGTVSPGASVGNLVINSGTMTWNPGGTFNFEYNSVTPDNAGFTTHDVITGTGTLDLGNINSGSPFTINITPLGFLPSPGSPVTYTIASVGTVANATGDITNRFTFTGSFDSPPTVMVAGNVVSLSFTPVPEPAHVLLACGAVAGLSGWIRRRRGRAGRSAS